MPKQTDVGNKGGSSGGKLGGASLPSGAGANVQGKPASPKK
jgi:hypothetical protein